MDPESYLESDDSLTNRWWFAPFPADGVGLTKFVPLAKHLDSVPSLGEDDPLMITVTSLYTGSFDWFGTHNDLIVYTRHHLNGSKGVLKFHLYKEEKAKTVVSCDHPEILSFSSIKEASKVATENTKPEEAEDTGDAAVTPVISIKGAVYDDDGLKPTSRKMLKDAVADIGGLVSLFTPLSPLAPAGLSILGKVVNFLAGINKEDLILDINPPRLYVNPPTNSGLAVLREGYLVGFRKDVNPVAQNLFLEAGSKPRIVHKSKDGAIASYLSTADPTSYIVLRAVKMYVRDPELPIKAKLKMKLDEIEKGEWSEDGDSKEMSGLLDDVKQLLQTFTHGK